MSVQRRTVDILITDDREDGLIAMEAVLSELPFVNIVKASSGEEALSLLDKHDFAVILLDVQMPHMDGFETAQRVRKHPDNKSTPIIFVTAINKDDEYIYRGYQVGAVDYIFKPFEARVLRSKVNIFIELYLKTMQLQEQNEIIRDSERREKFLRLAEIELDGLKRYRQLADSIPHIVWHSRPDGVVDYFNQKWSEYTGLTPEASKGSSWQDYFEPTDLKVFLKTWMYSMGITEGFTIESRIKDKHGEYRWHIIRAVPESRGGQVTGWLGTCTDIHDRKVAESKILDAQQNAVEANRAKTNFLANMSHEIRTPMGAILGFTELMMDPNQSQEQRQHCITTIRRSGQQLLSIIDEILDISKVEAGHLELENINVNLLTLLVDVESLLRVQTEKKGIILEFHVRNKIPENIWSDPTRIRQILMNIVGNAIKFTSEGKIRVQISWETVSVQEGILQFEVKDTGVGIAPGHVEKLFQPFAQVDSSTTRKFGGTGLGLALSRKLAQALGGNLHLTESTPGKGSTFTIDIKVKALNGTKWVSKISSQERDTPRPLTQSETHILDGVKVLLVEDAPENQTIIGLFLTSAGAKVEFADNGEEGVKKALEGDHNIVLMDIQMPYLDGYQATQLLRSNGFSKPIIALTAHAMKEERDRCLRVGCDDHFTKPIDRRKLINLVNEVVTLRHH